MRTAQIGPDLRLQITGFQTSQKVKDFSVVRTDERSGEGRAYGHMTTKFSRMDSLPKKKKKTGSKKTCNLFCIAMFKPVNNLIWAVARQVLCGRYNAQHRYSTRFAAIFCCPFFRTLSNTPVLEKKKWRLHAGASFIEEEIEKLTVAQVFVKMLPYRSRW